MSRPRHGTLGRSERQEWSGTMKRWIVLTVAAACLAGCNQTTIGEAREDSYGRWYRTRARALSNLAARRLEVGQVEAARKAAQEAVDMDPRFADARMVLGRVWIELGNFRAAITELGEACRLVGESAEAQYLLGVALERNGQRDRALGCYRRAHELDEQDVAPVIAAAEVLAADGRTVEAAEDINKYISGDGGTTAMLELAGRLAMVNGQYTKAAGHYQTLVERVGQTPRYQEELARAYFGAERFDLSRDALEIRIAMPPQPPSAWVHAMLGDSCMGLSRPHRASQAYESAVGLKPSSAPLLVKLSEAHLAAGDSAAAIRSARRALAIQPGRLDATLVLGYSLLRAQQAQAATRILEKASDLHPHSATLLCLLGRSYLAVGNDARARNCYERAAKTDPTSRLARKMLTSGG